MTMDKQFEARRNAYKNVKEANSLAETEFSELFHVARTTSPDNMRTNGYSSVSIPVCFKESGEYEVGEPVKTRSGVHFHVRNSNKWNTVISLPVRPFMETQVAKDELLWKISGPFRMS